MVLEGVPLLCHVDLSQYLLWKAGKNTQSSSFILQHFQREVKITHSIPISISNINFIDRDWAQRKRKSLAESVIDLTLRAPIHHCSTPVKPSQGLTLWFNSYCTSPAPQAVSQAVPLCTRNAKAHVQEVQHISCRRGTNMHCSAWMTLCWVSLRKHSTSSWKAAGKKSIEDALFSLKKIIKCLIDY